MGRLQVGSDYIPFAWADDDAAEGAAAMGTRAGAERGVGSMQWRATADVSVGGGGAHRPRTACGSVAFTVMAPATPAGSLCCSGQTHDWTKIRPVLVPVATAQGR